MNDRSSRLTGAVVERYRPGILTLANQLTILRIIFVPIFLILLVYGRAGAALLVFLAAALTDGLDGLIARRFGQKTSVGAILDPIADKLLLNSSIVVLATPLLTFTNSIPAWLMLLVISRDVFILAGSLAFILIYGFRVFTPSFLGKASTAVQLVTVLAVLVYNWLGVREDALDFLFVVAGLLTAASGLQYLVHGRRLIEE